MTNPVSLEGGNPPAGPSVQPQARPWTGVFAVFAFACLLSIGAFFDAWRGMLLVWSNSDTYAHGYIALPCAAWMIWRRREDWVGLPQRVWWPAVVTLAGCGALWLVGRLGGVASLEQFGAVSVIPATVLLLGGPAIARSLAFPLAFLFFAVPVGDFLTPIMMNYTADATVAALRLTGVPVYREGLHFSLSSGRWSVVEACSGLRYLIASVALGVLYAYLQFRTLRYRLAFVALAIVVPIVANWVRAYLIVMLGHLSDMRIAAGADHLIYGWLFFGLVMALLFWIGSRWREPPEATVVPESTTAPESSDAAPRRLPREAKTSPARATRIGARSLRAALVVAALTTVLWRPLSAALLDATRPVDVVPTLQAALEPLAPAGALDFAPRYLHAHGSVRAARSVDGHPVELHAFYYARQHQSGEMIHSAHFVARNDDSRAPILSQTTQSTPWGTVTAYHIAGGSSEDLLVWHWYAVSSVQTASAYRAKAATAWSLITGRGDHSLAIVLATPVPKATTTGESDALRTARLRLAKMADALGPAIVGIANGRAPRAGSLASNGLSTSGVSPLPLSAADARAR